MVGIRVYLVLVTTTLRWQTNPTILLLIMIILFLFLLTKTFTFFSFFLSHWTEVTSNCVLLIQYGHWLYLLLYLNGGSDDQSQQLNACIDTHRLFPFPFHLCTVTYRRLLTPAAPHYIKQCITCRRRLEETTVLSLVPRTIMLPWHYSNIIYIKQVTVCVTDHIILTLEHQITSDNASLVWLTSFPVTWHHTPTPRPDGDKVESSFNLGNLSQFSFTELSVKQLTCGGETSQRR